MTQRLQLEHLQRAPFWALKSQGMGDQKPLFPEGVLRVGGLENLCSKSFRWKLPDLFWPGLRGPLVTRASAKPAPNLGDGNMLVFDLQRRAWQAHFAEVHVGRRILRLPLSLKSTIPQLLILNKIHYFFTTQLSHTSTVVESILGYSWHSICNHWINK